MNEVILEKNNQQKLPKGWAVCSLDDICTDIRGGGTPSRNNPEYFKGDIPWLTPTEIPKDKILTISDSKERITNEALRKSSARIIPKGAVLLTSRATIGNVAISGTEVTTNQGFASFICNEAVYNHYLAYWLYGNRIILQNVAKGTTFKEISKSTLRELVISIPPLNEQKRIVSKIEECFSLSDFVIKTLDLLNTQISKYQKSLLLNAFVGKLTRGLERNPSMTGAKLLEELIKKREISYKQNCILAEKHHRKTPKKPDNLKDIPLSKPEILYEIPPTWTWCSLNSVCSQITDGEHLNPRYIEYGNLLLSAKNVRDGYITYENVDYISNEDFEKAIKRCKPAYNDILITSTGTIGRVAIVKQETPFAILRSVLLLKPDGINPEFLLRYLQTPFAFKLMSTASSASVQAHLYIHDMKSFPFPLPPLIEQKEILQITEHVLSKISKIREMILILKHLTINLKSSILKQAFEGKLVPQDPNDEPAEILLQKIIQEKEKLLANQKAIKAKSIKSRRIKNAS
jgi:type I restriction enzyme, S subunit